MRAVTLLSSLLILGHQALSNPLRISIAIDDGQQSTLTASNAISNNHPHITGDSDSYDGPFILQAFDRGRHATPFYLSLSEERPRLALQDYYDIYPGHGVFTLNNGQLKMGDSYIHYDPRGWLLMLPELPEVLVRWRKVDVDGLGPALAPFFGETLDSLFFTPGYGTNVPVFACRVPEAIPFCPGPPNTYLALKPFEQDL